jgi:hypothetical protein
MFTNIVTETWSIGFPFSFLLAKDMERSVSLNEDNHERQSVSGPRSSIRTSPNNSQRYPGVGDIGLRQSCCGIKMMLSAKHGLFAPVEGSLVLHNTPPLVRQIPGYESQRGMQATPLERAKTKELLIVPTLESSNGPCFWLCLERRFSCRHLITNSSDERPKQRSVSHY